MSAVLIVDDEFGVVEVLEAILTDAGYRVTTAADGRTAIKRMQTEHPDIVLLDYMMPVMNGCAVLDVMQTDGRFSDISVVMMSSLDEEVISRKLQGYCKFLRKPFRLEELLDTLANIVRK